MKDIPFAELLEQASKGGEEAKDDLITVTATREQWLAVNKAIKIALYWSDKMKMPEP